MQANTTDIQEKAYIANLQTGTLVTAGVIAVGIVLVNVYIFAKCQPCKKPPEIVANEEQPTEGTPTDP